MSVAPTSPFDAPCSPGAARPWSVAGADDEVLTWSMTRHRNHEVKAAIDATTILIARVID